MTDQTTTIAELRAKVEKFIAERDWEQFHTAKNLSMSIAIEAAELMELFQWQECPDFTKLNKKQQKQIRDELADVFVYVMDFCNLFGIDLSSAVREKMNDNVKKYPAKEVRGKSHKYTFYKQRKRTREQRK